MPGRGRGRGRGRRTRRVSRREGTRRVIQFNPKANVFVPSWLQKTVANTTRVVSNGINSVLREINTRRRRSLGETRKSR
jgi:hypothetical protein